jgi:hypothetical protein
MFSIFPSQPSQERVLSRHRLPRFYRLSLTALWLTPIAILTLTLLLRHRMFDVRLLVPFVLMAVPALYVWREGVDVLPSGIVRRIHIPRYLPYSSLETWYLDTRSDRRTLTVWDADQHKVLELRPGHLTEMPTLLKALKSNVRWRHWPV